MKHRRWPFRSVGLFTQTALSGRRRQTRLPASRQGSGDPHARLLKTQPMSGASVSPWPDLAMVRYSTGTVTMVFTDVESSRLLSRLGSRYAEALDAHRLLLREAWRSSSAARRL